MKTNTSIIETNELMTLVRCNERQRLEIVALKENLANAKSLVENVADKCIVDGLVFKYSSVPVEQLCRVLGMNCEEINEYVETAKKTDV